MQIQKFWLGDVCPFDESLNQIKDKQAKARILTRLRRLELGNRGDFKILKLICMNYELMLAKVGVFIIKSKAVI